MVKVATPSVLVAVPSAMVTRWREESSIVAPIRFTNCGCTSTQLERISDVNPLSIISVALCSLTGNSISGPAWY